MAVTTSYSLQFLQCFFTMQFFSNFESLICDIFSCSSEGNFREAQDNLIRFPDIESYILERVVKYLHYKAQYTNASTRIPDFLIEPETALELLIAAKYLDC